MNLQKLNEKTNKFVPKIQIIICVIIIIAGVIGYFIERFDLNTFLMLMIFGLLGMEFASIKMVLIKIEQKAGI